MYMVSCYLQSWEQSCSCVSSSLFQKKIWTDSKKKVTVLMFGQWLGECKTVWSTCARAWSASILAVLVSTKNREIFNNNKIILLKIIVNDRELYSNNITGEIPTELGDLRELVSLDLYQNKLSGPIPSSLGKLDKLRFLYVSFFSLTSSSFFSFG